MVSAQPIAWPFSSLYHDAKCVTKRPAFPVKIGSRALDILVRLGRGLVVGWPLA
jgi:hypothetical protein